MMDKWTLVLSRIPSHSGEDLRELDERLYEVIDVLLNDKRLRVKQAALVMSANRPISLHLEIMPRNLEIAMED